MHQLQQQIQRELNKEGFHDHLKRIRADEHKRLTRTGSPIVVTAESPKKKAKDYLLKPLKGSIVLFWVHKGSSLIATLEKAYATGDEKTLIQLSAQFTEQLEKRKIQPVRTAVEKLLAAPVYFDFLYGDKILASKMALVDGIEYGAMAFPYNGGKLNERDFKIIEFFKPFARAEYDTLVVITPPDLSAIEKVAVEAVPENQLGLNLGDSAICPGATVIVLIAIALVTCANGGCTAIRDKLAEVSLSATQIRRLGNLASARELLAMRREIFEEFGF